ADTDDGSRSLYKSLNAGYAWDDSPGKKLFAAMTTAEKANFRIWDIAMARDDINFVAAVTNTSISNLPGNIWISTDGGNYWHNSNLPPDSSISALDICSFNSIHFIAAGTRSGTGTGGMQIFRAGDVPVWTTQQFSGDVLSLKFSPNYKSDGAISVIYTDAAGTYLNTAIHDIQSNLTDWHSIYPEAVEISTEGAGSSARTDEIISADMALPADFCGQASPFRRYYVSIDAAAENSGIYRIDDGVVYWIMPASNSKRISSITYSGTCSSGKLLAGEVLGNPCSAAVMTWFTDAPVTCPGTCWYPSKKPPTGGAGTQDCNGSGYVNAQVKWSPDGQTAYCGTSSTGILTPGVNWPLPYLTGRSLDESSFSLSRNYGGTWNQISLIDTAISRIAEIAPAADCSRLYLASVNTSSGCAGFDSLWRHDGISTEKHWERILCKPTSDETCPYHQEDNVILKLAEDQADGQVIFWAAQNKGLVMWSPDYGELWFAINTGLRIRDMASEDHNTLFVLEDTGIVRKYKYQGGGWSSASGIFSGLDRAYSIATAFTANTPDNMRGQVMVGGKLDSNYGVSYSTDGGKTFNVIEKQLPTLGNTVVMASSSFDSDGTILTINSGGMYAWSVYEGNDQEWQTWWGGPEWPSALTGMAISRNYSLYLATPASMWSPATPYIRWSAALADLEPSVSLGDAEKPGRRIKICGGLVAGEDIRIYVIDEREYTPPQGGVWYYDDSLVWTGPLPTAPVSLSPVKFDPVSGRAGQINLTWNPVSLSKGYRIQLSKDPEFSKLLADIGGSWSGPFYTPYDPYQPALIIPPAGGNIFDGNGNEWNIPSLEANHPYYWRVKVQDVFTGDSITSPWSWRESFIVRQGFAVSSPTLGPQLLQPANACSWDMDYPVCFSWTPMHETQLYRFELSLNADLSSPVAVMELETTACQVSKLQHGTYFWRVRADKPYPSEWSVTGNFLLKSK
ncbi:MAG TPA: hypothetical protein VJ488_01240, partial [Dehalococcoidia bacterium]|nr:hypothetical protein [Dehalococcoidia bacterium]